MIGQTFLKTFPGRRAINGTDPDVVARRNRLVLLVLQVVGMIILVVCAIDAQRAQAQDLPDDPLSGEAKTLLLTARAEGVQIYNCAKDSNGQLTWQFREPLATLMVNGKTVGRHFAGPTWQLDDRSSVVGKVSAQVPGATPRDIALLRLDVVSHQGTGGLSRVVAVQRLHTEGGAYSGSCEREGDLHVEPYRADYRFLGQ